MMESRVKVSPMQELAEEQSEEIKFETTEKPTKITTMIANSPVA